MRGYVIVNKNYRAEIQDTRVKRGWEIYSDHYLGLRKINTEKQETTGSKQIEHRSNVRKEIIRSYKLREKEIAKVGI